MNVRLMGMVFIGNGWCEFYVCILMLCMINIYMMVGKDDLEEILKLCKKGFYVVLFGGG